MLHRRQEHMSENELERLRRYERGTLLSNLFGNHGGRTGEEQNLTDVYQVSATECFIAPGLSDEFPLYFLDVQDSILILSGQWLFDSHTMLVDEDIFDRWDSDRSFFKNFLVRCHAKTGLVFELLVEGSETVRAKQLARGLSFKRLRECEVVPGSALTLISDLERAGLVEPV